MRSLYSVPHDAGSKVWRTKDYFWLLWLSSKQVCYSSINQWSSTGSPQAESGRQTVQSGPLTLGLNISSSFLTVWNPGTIHASLLHDFTKDSHQVTEDCPEHQTLINRETETVGGDGNVRLTLYVELDGGVGHPHHVLRDTGQLEVVVVPADVEQSQVDGVDVGPVHVGLGWNKQRTGWWY